MSLLWSGFKKTFGGETLTEPLKTCTKCGEQKPMSEFYKDRGDCKLCKNERSKAYAESHRQQILDYHTEYRRQHPSQFKDWYQEHKTNRANYATEYRRKNADRIAAHDKSYRRRNRDKIRAYAKMRYQTNEEARKKRIARSIARVSTSITTCALANDDCGPVLERHHPDYSKPLATVTLCRKHHRMIHKQTREGEVKCEE